MYAMYACTVASMQPLRHCLTKLFVYLLTTLNPRLLLLLSNTAAVCDYTAAAAYMPVGYGLVGTYTYTGGVQSLVVSAGVTSLYVAVCGAKGGDTSNNYYYNNNNNHGRWAGLPTIARVPKKLRVVITMSKPSSPPIAPSVLPY